jgi:hypothetical protein
VADWLVPGNDYHLVEDRLELLRLLHQRRVTMPNNVLVAKRHWRFRRS